MTKPRWDPDERGRGVASAEAGVLELDRLRSAMLEPDWVTEEPELHLLPHVQRVCDERGYVLERAAVVGDCVLEVDVAVAGGRKEVREAGFELVGSFAESSTHIVERSRGADGSTLEITTGVLDGDSRFAPHGHVVRLAVRGSDASGATLAR